MSIPSLAGAQVPAGSTRTVDVLDTPTRVMVLGLEDREQGEPVLFLFAGAGSPLETWGEWVSAVSKLAPVVAYDRPGIGQSRYDGGGASPERMVSHAGAVLEVLEIAPPYILVGHSWGGPLALHFAGRHPDDVAGMVYLDPSNPRETTCGNLMASTDEECASRQAELDRRTAGLDLPPGRVAEQEAIERFMETRIDGRGLPEGPEVPTAVLLGTRGPPIGDDAPSFFTEDYLEAYMARRLRRYAEWIVERPNATLIAATDAGHFVHRSDPALATEAVRRVLAAALP